MTTDSTAWNIEDACIEACHAVRYTLASGRAISIVGSKCQEQIDELEG